MAKAYQVKEKDDSKLGNGWLHAWLFYIHGNLGLLKLNKLFDSKQFLALGTDVMMNRMKVHMSSKSQRDYSTFRGLEDDTNMVTESGTFQELDGHETWWQSVLPSWYSIVTTTYLQETRKYVVTQSRSIKGLDSDTSMVTESSTVKRPDSNTYMLTENGDWDKLLSIVTSIWWKRVSSLGD